MTISAEEISRGRYQAQGAVNRRRRNYIREVTSEALFSVNT